MSKVYNFEILSVNTETQSMEVQFTSNEGAPILVGTRIPLISENLNDVMLSYVPQVPYTQGLTFELMPVTVGQTGTVVSTLPTTAEEVAQQKANEKMWMEVEFDKTVAASLVRLKVLDKNPMELPISIL